MIEKNGVRWRLIRNVGRNALVIWHLVDLPLRSIEMKRKEKRRGKKKEREREEEEEREIGIHLSTCERPVKFITGGQVRRIVGKLASHKAATDGFLNQPTEITAGISRLSPRQLDTCALRLSPFAHISARSPPPFRFTKFALSSLSLSIIAPPSNKES